MKKFFFVVTIGYFSFSCKKNEVSAEIKYFPKVKSIIAANCMSCHSSSGTWQGRPTAFDTDQQIADLSDAIKASVADPVSPRNKRMPQGGSLSQPEVDIIVNWQKAGGRISD